MGQEGTDKGVAKPAASSGLTPERASQVSAENQGHSKPSWAASIVPIMLTLDGIPVPNFQITEVNGGSEQIDDCSKEQCVVNGKKYVNSKEIPGNQPKPLLHADGKAVLGPDGQPIVGPERVDLEQIARNATANRNWLSTPTALLNFRHSGIWDFQRVQTDDISGRGARPIFTQQYQNFSNIAVGYVLGSLGMSLDQMGSYANTYCSVRCNYTEPRSKQFSYIADRQFKDFEIGLELYKERHPDSKK